MGDETGVKSLNVPTHRQTELVDITAEVQRVVRESAVAQGLCCVYVPHTTAGITINENADPSVRSDILAELNKVIPFQDDYAHVEGNSAAHIKSTLVGHSAMVPVDNGRLALGTWQGIYLCEFDGPRSRRVLVTIR